MSACSFSTLRLNLVLTHGILPDVHGGVHIFLPPHTIGSVQSLSGHAIAYRWRSLPRVRWHRASIVLKAVRVTGAAFASPWTNYYCAPLFSHTHYYWYKVSRLCSNTKYKYYYCCTVLWTRFPPREDCCIVQVTCKTVAFRFFLKHSQVRVPWFSLQSRASCTPTEP